MSRIIGSVMYSAAATDRCTNAVRGAQLGETKGGASAHSRGPIGRVVISVDKEVLPRWMRGKLLRNHHLPTLRHGAVHPPH